jgi:peptidoglycan/LPS O-acetylase OafA/YrhL
LAVLAALLAVWGYGLAGGSDGRARRWFAGALLLALVLGSSAALGASGFLLDTQARPPRPMLMFAFVLGAIALGLSPVGRRLATGLPLAALVGFQAFRLPLEPVVIQRSRRRSRTVWARAR